MTTPDRRQYQPPYATGYGINGGQKPATVTLPYRAGCDPDPDPITLAMPTIARGPDRVVVQTTLRPDPMVSQTPFRLEPCRDLPEAHFLSEAAYGKAIAVAARREVAKHTKMYGTYGTGCARSSAGAITRSADSHADVLAMLTHEPQTANGIGKLMFGGNSRLASAALCALHNAKRCSRVTVGPSNAEVWGYAKLEDVK